MSTQMISSIQFQICLSLIISSVTGDSSVSTAIRYGLEVPGIESRWGQDLPHLSRPALGPTKPPAQWALRLFSGEKAAGAWRHVI
jgi:hypothetical protein